MTSSLWHLLDGPVLTGDCIEVMRNLPPNSVDAVVTDPPYGIGFMGHDWDRPEIQGGGASTQRGTPTSNQRFQAWCEAWATEAMRVLKPGAHMLAFGGTRTFHRMVAGIEDAGFEVRDTLLWLYGSGFPKSRNIEKALTGEADREARAWFSLAHGTELADAAREQRLAAGERLQAAAELHVGEGTALKPCWEPVLMARKPFTGSVTRNVLEHGTGGIDIESSRLDMLGARPAREIDPKPEVNGAVYAGRQSPGAGFDGGSRAVGETTLGRWPPNVALTHTEDCVLIGAEQVASNGHFPAQRGPSGYGSAVQDSNGGGLHGQEDLDERHFAGETVERWACVPGCPVRMLDEQSGSVGAGGRASGPTWSDPTPAGVAYGSQRGTDKLAPFYGDTGGASRFMYCGKATRAERDAGLEGFAVRPINWSSGEESPGTFQSEGTEKAARNFHPTVKPVGFIRWLVRMVTPPDGVVLDMFAGSGTTGCSAAVEDVHFVGIECDPEYVAIAEARIRWWLAHPEGVETQRVFAADKRRREVAAAGQQGLF